MKTLGIILILIDACIISYGIVKYNKLLKTVKKQFQDENIFAKGIYRICLLLMISFLIGYCVSIYMLLIRNNISDYDIVLISILFCGSIFIHVMIEVQKRMINIISSKSTEIAKKNYSAETHSKNEETLAKILDSIEAMICVSDLETNKVLFVNNAMKRIFGDRDIKDRVCWENIEKECKGTCKHCPTHNLKSVDDPPITWELYNTATDRHYKNMDLLIKWLDDRIVHMQYSVDITEFKHAIEEVKKSQAELIDARNLAEEHARSKSEFLSKMSHELRTPLNAIIGMINIIRKSEDIEKIKISMEKQKNASENLLQTINDILDISKIEAGKMELIRDEFNIKEMFGNIFNIIEIVAREKEIEIEINMKNDDMNDYFVGDAKRLSQVYMNLLSNAVKFTERKGKIAIDVKFEKVGEEEVKLISSVADTGIGIPEDKIPNLFQSFVQVDNTLSRQYTGTGLGLVIVKNIVELMGGSISIKSKVGVGTTFMFDLLLKQCKGKEDTKVVLEKANEEKFDFSGKTILLFEDVEVNREIIQFLLEDTGVTCIEAADGEIGVRLYNEDPEKYDLILMDIQMPNMDGFEATKRIRKSGKSNAKTIPIIAMTANVFAEQIQETLDIGMNSHLGKPVNELEIKKEIAKFIFHHHL